MRVAAAGFFLAVVLLGSGGLASSQEARPDGRQWVRALIHVNTKLSAGDRSAEELVALAEEEGIGIVAVTDQLLVRGEYGMWPLRSLLRKVRERQSVFTFGVSEYLAMLEKLDEEHPRIVILPGADVAPFYYWTGNPLMGSLTVNDWSKQLIVLGLDKPEDYVRLPVIANPYLRVYGWRSLLRLWPLLLVAFGVRLARYRKWDYCDSDGCQLCPVSRPHRFIGLLAVFIGVVFLANNVPFDVATYDAHNRPRGIAPYQNLIDDVRARGGLVFWSEPEVAAEEDWGSVRVVTPAHADDLLASRGYTGFGAVYGYERSAHRPGGEWDRVLLEYCSGARSEAVWAIAESEFEGRVAKLDAYETVLLVDGFTRRDALSALASGRMVAVYNHTHGGPVLEDFTLRDYQGGSATLGGQLVTRGPVLVQLKGYWEGRGLPHLEVRFICDGKEVELVMPEGNRFDCEYRWSLEGAEAGTKHYCRVIVDGLGELVTNPIFVKLP